MRSPGLLERGRIRKIGAISGIALGAFLLFYFARSTILLFIIIFLFAYLLDYPVEIICSVGLPPNGWRIPRSIGALLVMAIVLLLILSFLWGIVPPFLEQSYELMRRFPEYWGKIQQKVEGMDILTDEGGIPEPLRYVTRKAIDYASSLITYMIEKTVKAIIAFFSQIIGLFIIPIALYYILKDKGKLMDGCIRAMPPWMRDSCGDLLSDINRALKSYVRGQITLCLAVGLAVWLGLKAIGVDYAVALGVFSGITEAIPIIGPVIGAIPGIVLAFAKSPILALKALLLYIAIQVVENNWLVPRVMGNSLRIHPLVMMFIIAVMGEILGFVGMILAAPTAAVLRVFYERIRT